MQIPPNKVATVVVAALHVASLGALIYLPLYGTSALELSFNFVLYLLGGFGITVLYHRVWSHNAATLSRPVEYFFACCACFLLQGPGMLWAKEHITHHQHTDTELDPHNINQGFWWAHIEWIFFVPDNTLRPPARLASNPVIHWQDKYYYAIFFTLNVVLPLAVLMPFVSQPWWGILLVTALRLTICNHIVWCINSICHWLGKRPFSHTSTASDVWWFPLSLGEQYHNYHHTFPRDYRNGIRWYNFDPTKWLIAGLAKVGLASNLFTMPEEKVAAARASTQPATEPMPAPLGISQQPLAE